MPNVVVALLWMWLLDPTLGIINVAVRALGGPLIPFLSSTQMALPTIAGINIWRYLGYTALLVFAGLQTIPKDLYEAAYIDGSADSQTFFHITLPLLRPVLAFVVVTSVLGSFQIFDTVAVTTNGGPDQRDEGLQFHDLPAGLRTLPHGLFHRRVHGAFS